MGVSGQRHAPAALYPFRYPGAPGPFWTQGLEEKSSAPAGDRTPIVQPVVRHYTAWATADPADVRNSTHINQLLFRLKTALPFGTLTYWTVYIDTLVIVPQCKYVTLPPMTKESDPRTIVVRRLIQG
jgi:hypothetical protein